MKPKFTRVIDGIPTMTVMEHEVIVGRLVQILKRFLVHVDPDCGDPTCLDCEVWRPAWRAIAELKEKNETT
jgi:hypothetical protein